MCPESILGMDVALCNPALTPECVEILLDAGLNPSVKDSNGTPAMHYHPHPESIRLFVQAGCPVNILNETGGNILHKLASNSFAPLTDSTLMALSLGADTEIPDHFGERPLHLITSGNLAVAQILVDHCADLNATSTVGQAAWVELPDALRFRIST